jgi:Zn-dependent protease with chaperone function
MTYFLLAICLVFTLLLAFNLTASAATAALWRVISHRSNHFSPRKREQLIFSLRALPFTLSAILVFVFMLPAYLLFEPRKTSEIVSIELALIAGVSFLGISIALYRVVRSWLATRKLTSNWLANSEEITVPDVEIPTFRIQHPFPVIAVVGVFRPRLFIASQIFDLLSEAEFNAAIAHECGHLNSHDNFKRSFLRFCSDSLILPIGRGLDRAWSDSTESAADDHAASSGGKAAALDLASTLIKIARVAPRTASPAMPVGSFLVDANDSEVSHRVQRLIDAPGSDVRAGRGARSRFGFWLYPGVLFAVTVMIAMDTGVLRSVHNVTENIVHLFQ